MLNRGLRAHPAPPRQPLPPSPLPPPSPPQECYHSLVTHDSMSLCPICMRCTLNPAHRERMWRDVDLMIAQNPMPPEHAGRKVAVLCNDCQVRSGEVAFHFIGNKCASCGGYNTRVVG